MAQYIDKDALVAEIDRQKIGYNVDGKHSVEYDTTRKILNIIDTLEVKGVDFEEYYHEFLQKEWFGNSHVRTVSEMMAFTAKHFFELGMAVSNKAQKGE